MMVHSTKLLISYGFEFGVASSCSHKSTQLHFAVAQVFEARHAFTCTQDQPSAGLKVWKIHGSFATQWQDWHWFQRCLKMILYSYLLFESRRAATCRKESFAQRNGGANAHFKECSISGMMAMGHDVCDLMISINQRGPSVTAKFAC